MSSFYYYQPRLIIVSLFFTSWVPTSVQAQVNKDVLLSKDLVPEKIITPNSITAETPIWIEVQNKSGDVLPGIPIGVIEKENAHPKLRTAYSIGKTNAEGKLSWTPKNAGVVVITAGKLQKNASVRYPSLPVSGIIIALFAGVILIGGAAKNILDELK